MEFWFYPVVFAIGLMIGATGIGGVALAPAINLLLGVPLHAAIAIAMPCFVATGILGTAIYQWRGKIRWAMVPVLAIPVGVSAFLGAILVGQISAEFMRIVLGLLMLAFGFSEIFGKGRARPDERVAATIPSGKLAGIGIITGAGSALTATGGPLILVPLLLAVSVPLQTAVGLGQVAQLLIGIMASVSHGLGVSPDLALQFRVASTIGFGAATGAILVAYLSLNFLRSFVAFLILLFGAAYLLAPIVN